MKLCGYAGECRGNMEIKACGTECFGIKVYMRGRIM
jgi:hypothetical protein